MKQLRLCFTSLVAITMAFSIVGCSRHHEERVEPQPVAKPFPILPPDRVTERRKILAQLRAAETAQDLGAVAHINAGLAQEAWTRALRAEKAWEGLRDPETSLVPRSDGQLIWNGKDTASDLWPFLLLASQQLNPSQMPLWLEAMASDRKLCGALPKVVQFNPTQVIDIPLKDQVFGGAEYIKDGLVFITEKLGRGPWFDRMAEVADALVQNAQQMTKRGPIVANSTEVNGDVMVFLPRLYWATRKPAYLEMAERIADVYLLDMMPAHSNLPAFFWDFEKNAPSDMIDANSVIYRDHGNEIIFGLAEFYFLERRLGLPNADKYRAPLQLMLDKMLTLGRLENGLWCDGVDVSTGVIKKHYADTWGYVLNAYMAFDLAEGTTRYAAEVQRTMRGAAQLKSHRWEGFHFDGYADTLESMMYMLPWFDLPECRAWLDDEMEILYSFQQPSGFIRKQYLDGNFIRTVMLYASYKTQGVSVEPWRDDLQIGAARDSKTGGLVIYASATQPWKGVLKCDRPRHREIWQMPLNYPRLNAPSEWFVAEPESRYVVQLQDEGPREVSGADLVAGLPLTLSAQATRQIVVSPAKPAEIPSNQP